MRIDISTDLSAPAASVWAHAQTSALLRYVAAPLVIFEAKDPASLPPVWREGRYRVALKVFGWLPFGDQWIVIEHTPLDDGAFGVRDNGYSALIRRWDHHIVIQPTGDGECRYRDTLDVEAGLLTVPIWLFAQLFYRHRQSRWRKLAASGFAELPSLERAL